MHYKNRLNALLKELYPEARTSETDRVWNEWLDLVHEREPRDLQSLLLLPDIHSAFKARALVVLLSPSLALLPFRWSRSEPGWQYIDPQWIEFNQLSEDLRHLLYELVCIGIRYASSHKKDSRACDALERYNGLILHLLAIMPETDHLAGRLFEAYSINDPTPFSCLDDASGYRPLAALLSHPSVPLIWKVRADRAMRRRVIAEYEGREKPRVDWEDALRHYVNLLERFLDRQDYPRELLVAQLDFILDLPNFETCPRALFSDWKVGQFLPLLSGEKRHRFARQVILGNTQDPFHGLTPKSYAAACRMLEDFSDVDGRLAMRLKALIKQAADREVQNAAHQRQVAEKTNSVLTKMRA